MGCEWNKSLLVVGVERTSILLFDLATLKPIAVRRHTEGSAGMPRGRVAVLGDEMVFSRNPSLFSLSDTHLSYLAYLPAEGEPRLGGSSHTGRSPNPGRHYGGASEQSQSCGWTKPGGCVAVLDCRSQRVVCRILAHSSEVVQLRMAPSGTMLATASIAGSLCRVFAVPSGQLNYTLRQASFPAPAAYLNLTPTLAPPELDNDTQTPQRAPGCSLALCPQERYLLSCAASGWICVFRVAPATARAPRTSLCNDTNDMEGKTTPDFSLICPGDLDGTGDGVDDGDDDDEDTGGFYLVSGSSGPNYRAPSAADPSAAAASADPTVSVEQSPWRQQLEASLRHGRDLVWQFSDAAAVNFQQQVGAALLSGERFDHPSSKKTAAEEQQGGAAGSSIFSPPASEPLFAGLLPEAASEHFTASLCYRNGVDPAAGVAPGVTEGGRVGDEVAELNLLVVLHQTKVFRR